MKKLICLFMAALLICFTYVCAAAESTDEITAFCVNGCSDTSDSASVDIVKWWYCEQNDKYYVFLPSSADIANLTMWFNATGDIKVGERTLINGEKTDAFAAGGEFAVSVGSRSYNIVFLTSDKLPAVYISTASGNLNGIHADKEHKEEGSIRITQNGEDLYNGKLASIKGRGNSTWGYVKKPYNIKLDKKTNLFGLGKAKSWCLLANYMDKSMIRNQYLYSLSDECGLYYTSGTQSIDLYINNEYLGNYLLTEKVEIGDNRIEITDLEKLNEDANPDIDIESCTVYGDKTLKSGSYPNTKMWADIPNNPEDITGGYLLEYEFSDRYYKEVSGFVTSRAQPIVIKSPEYASQAEVDYISDYVQQAEDAIYSKTGYNSLGKHYSEYIDVDSFVRAYLIHEFSMNIDAALSSFYLYKDVNGKLVASPVWDFDRTLGDNMKRCSVDYTNPSLFAARVGLINGNRTMTILAALCQHDEFLNHVTDEWNSNFLPKISLSEAYWNSRYDAVSDSAVMNAIRWNVYNTADVSSLYYNYSLTVAENISFIADRIQFLSDNLVKDGLYVRYDENGGTGPSVIDPFGYSSGDTVTLQQNRYTLEGKEFKCWNTEPDGSGISYKAGDKIQISSTIYLYAQWKGLSITTKTRNFFKNIFQQIKDFFDKINDFFRRSFEQIKIKP